MKTIAWSLLLISTALLMGAGCPATDTGTDDDDVDVQLPPDPPDNLPVIRNTRLRTVNDWAYQLQGDPELDLNPIMTSAFDLVVIDYSATGDEDGKFTANQITALKQTGKIVLAYMSIGEAEVGRFYFDNSWITPNPDVNPNGPFSLTNKAPGFLAPPNPDFPDNFKVRYFDPSWQQIIIHNPGNHPVIGNDKSYLDQIIDSGFDGVYLDIIDAFEFFGPTGNNEKPDAASQMIDFVIGIANHARQTRGRTDFIVVPQNGANIIASDFAEQRRADYFAAIDGIGAEDSFYFGDEEDDNQFDPQTSTIINLDLFREAGLLVLAIDYLTEVSTINDFYSRARARSWIPYASNRSLDELTINPTQLPD